MTTLLLKLVILLVTMETVVVAQEDYLLTCPRPIKHKWRSGRWLRLQEEVLRGVPCGAGGGGGSGGGGWWCGVPGEKYPWPAVRRFITENTGLMRRMYGEVRQLNLLRMEFSDTNTIDDYEDKPRNIPPPSTPTMATTTMPTTSTTSDSMETVAMTTETIMPAVDMVTEQVVFGDGDGVSRDDSGEVSKGEESVGGEGGGRVGVVVEETKPVIGGEPRPQVQEGEKVKRAVNACPVREEVVAPYWANNTRGEILALLNLYPFEQYVHWEKCNHEHKQMWCREGCRCEQQYRLHRLLAFDPTNECRGIFSDWFRFPSCCICKCYLSEEEIATHLQSDSEVLESSRSPRGFEDFDDFYDEPDVAGVDRRFFFKEGGSGSRRPR